MDPKHNKYTINVMADDKLTEKKDKNVNEPVQFYTSKARQPYEMVVNQVQKDRSWATSPPRKNNGRPVTRSDGGRSSGADGRSRTALFAIRRLPSSPPAYPRARNRSPACRRGRSGNKSSGCPAKTCGHGLAGVAELCARTASTRGA